MRRITKLAPNEFRFEFEDIQKSAELSKGDKFTHEGGTYKIVYCKRVFDLKEYYSFIVVAEEVTLQSAID